jgi:hypothetical protein
LDFETNKSPHQKETKNPPQQTNQNKNHYQTKTKTTTKPKQKPLPNQTTQQIKHRTK